MVIFFVYLIAWMEYIDISSHLIYNIHKMVLITNNERIRDYDEL